MKKLFYIICICIFALTLQSQKGGTNARSKVKQNQMQPLEIKEFLKVHNDARKQKGSPPLEYDAELSKFAQNWADHLQKIGKLEHRADNNYGENCYWGSGNGSTIVNAAKSWLSEQKYDRNGIQNSQTGHYTQMVWKNTTKVGVGISIGKNGVYVVANYNPPGNYSNEKAY